MVWGLVLVGVLVAATVACVYWLATDRPSALVLSGFVIFAFSLAGASAYDTGYVHTTEVTDSVEPDDEVVEYEALADDDRELFETLTSDGVVSASSSPPVDADVVVHEGEHHRLVTEQIEPDVPLEPRVLYSVAVFGVAVTVFGFYGLSYRLAARFS